MYETNAIWHQNERHTIRNNNNNKNWKCNEKLSRKNEVPTIMYGWVSVCVYIFERSGGNTKQKQQSITKWNTRSAQKMEGITNLFSLVDSVPMLNNTIKVYISQQLIFNKNYSPMRIHWYQDQDKEPKTKLTTKSTTANNNSIVKIIFTDPIVIASIPFWFLMLHILHCRVMFINFSSYARGISPGSEQQSIERNHTVRRLAVNK